MGVCGRAPETLVVCPHNSYCLLARSHAIHVLLSNPSKMWEGYYHFMPVFQIGSLSSAPSFPREAELMFAVIVTDSDGGGLGAWHM